MFFNTEQNRTSNPQSLYGLNGIVKKKILLQEENQCSNKSN